MHDPHIRPSIREEGVTSHPALAESQLGDPLPFRTKLSVFELAASAGLIRPMVSGAGAAGHWSPKDATQSSREPTATMAPSRILIAYDGPLVRAGLKSLLSAEYRNLIFVEVRTASEALMHIIGQSWDLVVLDAELASPEGFDALRKILTQRPATHILLISATADPPTLARAKASGALGHITINAARTDFLRAVKTVLAGKTYFPHALPDVARDPTQPEHASLSRRECDVVLAIVAGKRVTEIARELKISVKSVSTYKRRALAKTDLKTVADLVRHFIHRPVS